MSKRCILSRRPVDTNRALSIRAANPQLTDLEATLLAGRGAEAHDTSVPELLAKELTDLHRGAERLCAAIERREHIVVIADYDCDGATACAVAVAGLRALGASISYVVPDRMVHGYGISPSVVDLARERFPQVRVLVTVDNGILGFSGITYAAHKGLDIVVTDHHLPGASIPLDAVAVIDPARGDDDTDLSRLAGVGVALWLVIWTKKLLGLRGHNVPSVSFLLPYVAIGTVADLVWLSAYNRRLVATGLEMMRKGAAPVGVLALIQESGTPPEYLTTQDIGFGLGPRINAAGRLDTMDAGIELLLTQDAQEAARLAKLLTETNTKRKQLQREATDEAEVSLDIEFSPERASIVRASHRWHPGIVGLVASRLKENYFRPTFVFSQLDGVAKGSGRSIPGFHLKDALEEVARRYPGVLAKFGGHAMAAGATLTSEDAVDAFEFAFEKIAAERITPEMLANHLQSDGPVPALALDTAARILRHPWGQGFEAPAFDEEAAIVSVRPLGSSGLHWRVGAALAESKLNVEVVLFNHPEPVANQNIHLYLQPNLNTWNGRTNLQWGGRILE